MEKKKQTSIEFMARLSMVAKMPIGAETIKPIEEAMLVRRAVAKLMLRDGISDELVSIWNKTNREIGMKLGLPVKNKKEPL